MSEPPVLHAQDTGVSTNAEGDEFPMVVVDAAKYPEVSELARAHGPDEDSDISTEALCLPWGKGHLFLLGIRVTVPVRCAFAVGFSLPAQRPVLDAAVAAGRLIIATTDASDGAEDMQRWLSVDLDPADLQAALP